MAALRGHQRQILERINAGICVDPKDGKGLADAILLLSKDPGACREMGHRGKAFAEKHFCLDDILNRYADLVSACASGEPAIVDSHSKSTLLSHLDHI